MIEKIEARHAEVTSFVRESLRIEGIGREPWYEEVCVTRKFLNDAVVGLAELATLVGTYEPSARLRHAQGMDVRVGDYVPPRGGEHIAERLNEIIVAAETGAADAWSTYVVYEALHPWTDGNGRSGRALWARRHLREGGDLSQLFQNAFHYQTLRRYAR